MTFINAARFLHRRGGPLARATSTQLAALRALAVAYRDWDPVARPNQPDVPAIGRHLSLPMGVEREFASRHRARRAGTNPTRRPHPPTGSVAVVLAGILEELTHIRVALNELAAHGEHEREESP